MVRKEIMKCTKGNITYLLLLFSTLVPYIMQKLTFKSVIRILLSLCHGFNCTPYIGRRLGLGFYGRIHCKMWSATLKQTAWIIQE